MVDEVIAQRVIIEYGLKSPDFNNIISALSNVDNALQKVASQADRVDKFLKSKTFNIKFNDTQKSNFNDLNKTLIAAQTNLLKIQKIGQSAAVKVGDAIASAKDVGLKESDPSIRHTLEQFKNLKRVIDVDTQAVKELGFAVDTLSKGKIPLVFTKGKDRHFVEQSQTQFDKAGGLNQQLLRGTKDLKFAPEQFQISNINKAAKANEKLAFQLNSVRRATKRASIEMKHGDEKARSFTQRLRIATSSSVLLLGPLSAVGARIATIGTIAAQTGVQIAALLGVVALFTIGIYTLSKAVFTTGVELDKINKRLIVTEGATVLAKNAIKELRDLADRTGTVLLDMAEGFSKLTFASKGTRLEGGKIKKIFEDVTFATAKMQLGAEETKGILKALEQIMSKGIVQAEELRGQLGDRLPGAFNIAARSMKLTTAELNKMLKAGRVISDDFLPKFATELRKTYGATNTKVIDTATAAVNRLKNSFALLFEAFNNAANVSGIIITLMNSLSSILKVAANNAELLFAVFITGSATGFLKFISFLTVKIAKLTTSFIVLYKWISVTRFAALISPLTKLGVAFSLLKAGTQATNENISQIGGVLKSFKANKSARDLNTLSNVFTSISTPVVLYTKNLSRMLKLNIVSHFNKATKSSKAFNVAITGLSAAFTFLAGPLKKVLSIVVAFFKALSIVKILLVVTAIISLVSVVSLLGDKWKKTREEIERYNSEQDIELKGTHEAIKQTRRYIDLLDERIRKQQRLRKNQVRDAANQGLQFLPQFDTKKLSETIRLRFELSRKLEEQEKLYADRNKISSISDKYAKEILTQRVNLHKQEVVLEARQSGRSKNYVSSLKRQMEITAKFNKMRKDFISVYTVDGRKISEQDRKDIERFQKRLDKLKTGEINQINTDATIFGNNFIKKAKSAGVLIEQNKEKVKQFRKSLEGQFVPGNEAKIEALVAGFQSFLDLKVKEKFDKIDQSIKRTNLTVAELGKYKPDLEGLTDSFKRTDAIDSFREKVKSLTSDTQTINEYVANFTESYDALVEAQEKGAARLEFWTNMENTAKSAINGVGDAIANLIVGQKSLLESLADVARSAAASIIKELYKVFIAKKAYGFIEENVFSGTAGKSILGIAINAGSAVSGSSIGSSSGGNIITPNPSRQYAKGGVVNSITPFLNNNKPSVMGEAGPEAILPLGRTSKGDLGVQIASGQNTSKSANITNVYNLTVNTQSTGNQQSDDFNAKRNAKEITNALKHMQTQSDNQRSNQLNQRVSTS